MVVYIMYKGMKFVADSYKVSNGMVSIPTGINTTLYLPLDQIMVVEIGEEQKPEPINPPSKKKLE